MTSEDETSSLNNLRLNRYKLQWQVVLLHIQQVLDCFLGKQAGTSSGLLGVPQACLLRHTLKQTTTAYCDTILIHQYRPNYPPIRTHLT
jgi:hypothetical protein